MKLYLSSYRIPDPEALTELIGTPPSETKVALIPNAKDPYARRAREAKIQDARDGLVEYGYQPDVVDLNGFANGRAVAAVLRKYGLIWVAGGNVFCLREAMAESGFDEIIGELLDGERIVYGGESAGACVAGTDLHGFELADDARFAGKVVWDGLGLAPHYFMPHADSLAFVGSSRQVQAARGGEPGFVALNDNQAWIMHGDEAWMVTARPQGGAEHAR